jgi:hypothetical protein
MRFALVTIETDDSRRHSHTHRADHRARIEAWMTEQARRGRLVGGEAFDTEQPEPVTVRRDPDGTATVTEGPFAGDHETLGGYLLVEVADRDEAVDLARSWPTGETIEVRPLWSAP